MNRLARIGILATLLLFACLTTAAAESKINTAREHLANQELDQAYALLVTLVDTNTAESDAYLFLGVLERDRGALQRAINVFEQGVSKGSADAALLSELAMTYAWKQRFREALQTYERILGKTPDHRGALLGSARVLAWAGRDSKAMSIYKAVLQDDPSDLEAMRGLAFVHKGRLELREAKALYQRVLSESPDDAESLEGLRSIQQTKRLRLEAAFGVARDASGSLAPSGTAAVQYRYDHKSTLRAQWQSSASAFTGASATDLADANEHRASIGISRKLGTWVSADLGYQVRMSEDTVHAIQLATGLKLSEHWNLDLGLRPGISNSGNKELLLRAGTQYTISPRLYLMAQLFRNWSAQEGASSVLVGSVGAAATKRLSLRASAAKGSLTIGSYTGISLAVQQNTSNSQHLFLRAEATLEPFTRENLIAGVGRSF